MNLEKGQNLIDIQKTQKTYKSHFIILIMGTNADLLIQVKKLLVIGQELSNYLENGETGYSDQQDYLSWIKSEMILLSDALSLLENNRSYGSIFPIIRTVFEDFWVILLAMNGTKYYQYFKIKKGHSIDKLYNKWKKDLEDAQNKGASKDILLLKKTKKRIVIARIGTFVKNSNEIIPFYYWLLDRYDPTQAYVGKEKRIIENYLTPPYLLRKHLEIHELFKEHYFDSKGIHDSLLLNGFVKKSHIQKINVHYNFLSSWVHPNKKKFDLLRQEYDFWKGNKKSDFFLDHLALLYIGNMASMFLHSFLDFANRQICEKKLKGLKDGESIKKELANFENSTNYFWFLYNKPSFFHKYNYCINRGWRSIQHKRAYKTIMPSQIPDNLVPYYNDPIRILREMSRGCYNKIYGKYDSPFTIN
jgi:hypothetical protein